MTKQRRKKPGSKRSGWVRPLRELRRRRLARLKRAEQHKANKTAIQRIKAKREKDRAESWDRRRAGSAPVVQRTPAPPAPAAQPQTPAQTRQRRRATARAGLAKTQTPSTQPTPAAAADQPAVKPPAGAASYRAMTPAQRTQHLQAVGLCGAPTLDGSPCLNRGACPHHRPAGRAVGGP